ncbi:MAG: hypothetical protein U9R53_06465 [Chloroflexota bacterium]|nr:hypothetical protein [Chloroflexota bacterium]
MRYRIVVCNLQTLGNIDGDALVTAITHSNYHTLCEQYGLNPDLVGPGMVELKVLAVSRGVAPFFVLHYNPNRQRPIVISEWNLKDPAVRKWLETLQQATPSHEVVRHLQRTCYVVSIALTPTQLEDLGRLLAYELARWAAKLGRGLVRGLDGKWYRLNDYKAFIPV